MASPSSSATPRSAGWTTVLPPTTLITGWSPGDGQRPSPLLLGTRSAGSKPPVRDLVAIEEPPELGAGRLEEVADDEGTRGRRGGGKALQPTRPADPMRGQSADGLPHVRGGSRDGVVVARLESQDA